MKLHGLSLVRTQQINLQNWVFRLSIKKDSLYKISVKSTERWSSLFLIQLSLDAPPPTAISVLSPLPCSTYSRTSRPEQNPTRTVTRAFITNTPSILGQVSNHKNAIGGSATETPWSASRRVCCAQRSRLRLGAAVWFNRLGWATSVMGTGPLLEKTRLFPGNSEEMPAILIIPPTQEQQFHINRRSDSKCPEFFTETAFTRWQHSEKYDQQRTFVALQYDETGRKIDPVPFTHNDETP